MIAQMENWHLDCEYYQISYKARYWQLLIVLSEIQEDIWYQKIIFVPVSPPSRYDAYEETYPLA